MDSQRKYPQDERTVAPQEPVIPGTDDTSVINSSINRIERALGESMQEGDVLVISGANSQPFPVATRTVGEVRAMLHHIMNIGPEATALVNGIQASPDHTLMEGDMLEFTKEGGEKG